MGGYLVSLGIDVWACVETQYTIPIDPVTNKIDEDNIKA